MSPSKITKIDRYKKVSLTNSVGTRNKFGIHRLCALAFIPNPDNLPEVNHKDGDRSHNHVLNFEWVTHRENVHHGKVSKKLCGVVGIFKDEKRGTWKYKVYFNKKHCGKSGFATKELAIAAYSQFCEQNGISQKYVA